MTATFFVTTDWIGRSGFMSWAELRQIAGWGMSVQSHTKSHPFLSELNETALIAELAGSKEVLDRELGHQTTEISLPGGDFPPRPLRHLLYRCGYSTVASSRWGRNHDVSRGALRRCSMRGELTVEKAQRILDGDAPLAFSNYTKELALNSLRRTLGAGRYARWRRRFLESL
jgi:peptidoglycan/xylan/chitin deacetylase (PgdA/CDA1 family)